MITQEFKQGKHEIKIESAESIEDAKLNNFKQGEYTRFLVNGKLTDNYMAMIRFMVDEARNNGTNPIPDLQGLMHQRNEMFQRQGAEINKQLEALKKQYGEMGIPQNIIDKIDDFAGKIDPMGVRIKE